MAHLIHILFVAFYRRTLLCILVLALAWDFYYAGPKDSVLLYGVLTLSERALAGSQHLPDLMDQTYDALRSFYQSLREASAAFINNNPSTNVSVEAATLGEDVVWALSMAAMRTGVSADYLAKLARLESNHNTNAIDLQKNSAGLYALEAATWLSLMNDFGGSYGKGGFAYDVICTSTEGCAVPTQARHQEILDLRFDGMTSTFLAAELTRTHKAALETKLGRDATHQDLYLAHIMGPDDAVVFIRAVKEAPFANASDLLPDVAEKRHALFYGPLGSQRTVATINALLTEKWTTCEEGDTVLVQEPTLDNTPTS